MKKYIYFLGTMLLVSVSVSVSAIDNKLYEVELILSSNYKYLASIKYTNKSKIAHCIRSNDFDLRGVGDFLTAQNESGKALRYIGPKSAYKEIMYPDSYRVVPPGASTSAPFYMNEFYKMKGKSFTVSYTFPVIDCHVILDRYIKMPPPESINSSIKLYGSLKLEDFKDSYPDWYKEGFLAISNKLEFKKQ